MTSSKFYFVNRRLLKAYVPVFLWIGLIFFLSSSQGSMSETSRFIGPLLHFLFPNASEETIQLFHGLIRKFAHFIEYAILAFLVIRALSGSMYNRLIKLRFILPIIVVSVIALIDEVNQSFQSSRSGSGFDVLLDIFGGMVAVSTAWLLGRPKISNIQNKTTEKLN